MVQLHVKMRFVKCVKHYNTLVQTQQLRHRYSAEKETADSTQPDE